MYSFSLSSIIYKEIHIVYLNKLYRIYYEYIINYLQNIYKF